MPKKTLLQITQDILSDANDDQVNSINDTVSALQVAQIVKTTYEEIISGREWPHLHQLIKLTGLSDANYPTYFNIPDDTIYIDWIKYNKKSNGGNEKYKDVIYMQPKDFLDYTHQRNSSSSNVQTVTHADYGSILIVNDKQPDYWTSFDDEQIIMDSFDNAVDSTLQSSKVQAHAYVEPTLALTDSATPDLPAKAFAYLMAEAKSTCFNTLFQSANSKEEQKSRRQRMYLSRNARRENKGIRTPDYGRKGPGVTGSANSDTSAPSENRPSYLPS